MDLSIAICDDEPRQRDYLQALVGEWAGKSGVKAKVSQFGSAEAFKTGLEWNSDFDILLLDIQMGGQDGVALAKELRQTDERLMIVFITGVPDFIQEGYDVSALHYIMKPVNEDRLFGVLDRAVKMAAKAGKTLFLPVDGETVRVNADDIMYIESFAHYIEITSKDGKLAVKMPAYQLEKELQGEPFARCHRSYIVGLKHVNKITKTDVVLDGGKIIPMSRRMAAEVNRAWMAYFKRSC